MAFADPGKLLITEEAIMKVLTALKEGGGEEEDFPGSGSGFCLHNWRGGPHRSGVGHPGLQPVLTGDRHDKDIDVLGLGLRTIRWRRSRHDNQSSSRWWWLQQLLTIT
jgi:hypothetical protein